MNRKIAGILLAMISIGIIGFAPSFASADTQMQSTWVRVQGYLNTWNMTDGNSTAVFGWISANAAIENKNGTIHEWAMVHATWSDRVDRINPQPQIGNWSTAFSFYTANLVQVSEINFTRTGYTLYISGLWNASKITQTINVTQIGNTTEIKTDRVVEPIAINATGYFGVPNSNWLKCELSIDGVGILVGPARQSFLWNRELKIGDLDGRGKVDIQDLVKVAKHYGQVPGMYGYDLSLDVNGDGKIDIGDLITIAANIG